MPLATAAQFRLTFLLPAYTAKARLYRTGVKMLSLLGIGFPQKLINLPVDFSHPLTSLVKRFHLSEDPPVILPGNPNSPAQRIVILPLGPSGNPVAVIKAGFSEDARRLIQQERDFLTTLQNSSAKAGPKLLHGFTDAHISAFAMDFEKGSSPAMDEAPGCLLTTWIDASVTAPIVALKDWSRLSGALQNAGLGLQGDLAILADQEVHPVLYHGDFAPWNVRVEAGVWKAIDWERGEFQGVPCWDWFHYYIQPAILVKRLQGQPLLDFIKSLPADRDLMTYAEKAGVEAHVRSLLHAYLLYNWYVLKPTERRSEHEALAIWALHSVEPAKH